jgi:hypothetical protein
MYASDPKSAGYKEWQSAKRAAVSNWRNTLKESELGYRIMMNSMGEQVPEFTSPDHHTVEMEAMQERLSAIDPNWLLAQGNYTLPAILEIARKRKIDPFRMISLIEEEYQASGGQLGQAQQSKRNKW